MYKDLMESVYYLIPATPAAMTAEVVMSWTDPFMRQTVLEASVRKELSTIDETRRMTELADATRRAREMDAACMPSSSLAIHQVRGGVLDYARHTNSIEALTGIPSYLQDLLDQERANRALMGVTTPLDYLSQISKAASAQPSALSQVAALTKQELPFWQRDTSIYESPKAWQLNDIASVVLERSAAYTSISDAVTAVSRVQAPWLDARNPTGSVSSFAAIHEIGLGISRAPFEPEFTSILRAQMGDWRDVDETPPAIFVDPALRTEFYLERGFRAELIDFPPDALEEIIESAGLAVTDDEENLRWRDRVSPYIGRIESGLRRYVNSVMTKARGADWTKGINPEMVKRWEDTKQKRLKEGRAELPHLIYYSELSDLQQIMQQRDHFVYFAPKFQRAESMQETFRRVLPARHAVAHVGIVTPIDYLTVMTEFARLLHVIAPEETS